MSSGGVTIYAIIETGGKQYKVSPGESLKVESLEVAEGGTIDLDRVLAIHDGENLILGKPVIEGAKVSCTSKGDGLDKKVYGMKYKAKVRYSRRIGHRQSFTELVIDSISGPGIATEAPKAKKAKAVKAETSAEEAAAEKPAPRTRRTTKKEVTKDGS